MDIAAKLRLFFKKLTSRRQIELKEKETTGYEPMNMEEESDDEHEQIVKWRICEDDYRDEAEWQENEDEVPKVNELLSTTEADYKVLGWLGRGTFGQVLLSERLNDGSYAAMKVAHARDSCFKYCLKEAQLLTMLNKKEKTYCITLYECVRYQDRLVLIFEKLDIDLEMFMKHRLYQPLMLREVHYVIHQVLSALQFLHVHEIVHLDVKPDNIMLVDHLRQPLRVKLIDFNSAFHLDEPQTQFYAQTRYYRAPEVLLAAEMGPPVDMWSLGCVAAELATGRPLFPGIDEADQIYRIVRVVGGPTEALLHAARHRARFFTVGPGGAGGVSRWRIKSRRALGLSPFVRYARLSSLDEVGELHEQGLHAVALPPPCRKKQEQFIHMLREMLQIDPEDRVGPGRALSHPFMRRRPAAHCNLPSAME